MADPRFVILDVGHGSAAVIASEDGVIAIDAGPGTGLLEFLLREGIPRVDVVLISHADEDHIRGLIALLAAAIVSVGRVCLNTDSEKESNLWESLLYQIESARASGGLDEFSVGLTPSRSGSFDIGRVSVEIAAPSEYLAARGPGSTDHKERPLTAHSVSAVVRLLVDGRPVLLVPGDLDQVGLDNLAESGVPTDAPIVVFPHHGGKPGRADMATFARQLCTLTGASTYVFSIGRGKHRTPQPKIIDAVRRSCVGARIACTQLSQRCAADVPHHGPTHLAHVYASGAATGTCCAGSIVVSLDGDDLDISPAASAHAAFLTTDVPGALCKRPLH